MKQRSCIGLDLDVYQELKNTGVPMSDLINKLLKAHLNLKPKKIDILIKEREEAEEEINKLHSKISSIDFAIKTIREKQSKLKEESIKASGELQEVFN